MRRTVAIRSGCRGRSTSSGQPRIDARRRGRQATTVDCAEAALGTQEPHARSRKSLLGDSLPIFKTRTRSITLDLSRFIFSLL